MIWVEYLIEWISPFFMNKWRFGGSENLCSYDNFISLLFSGSHYCLKFIYVGGQFKTIYLLIVDYDTRKQISVAF